MGTKNWSLDENPGMRLNKPENAQQGLYYYYHTLAKALNAYDQPTITDGQGNPHDWRVELIDKLSTLQKEDGSFVGDKKWMEENPVLTTSYVVVAPLLGLVEAARSVVLGNDPQDRFPVAEPGQRGGHLA